MFQKLIFFTLIMTVIGCSSTKSDNKSASIPAPKEFSRGELILGTQLLTKIFDQEMAPLACVPDVDEASLLLRTIRPRMEVVQDDMEALLDDANEVNTLIQNCDQSCTCGYVDELVREHLVSLTKAQRKALNAKKSDKELSRCLNFVQTTFCQGELYKTLESEKADFSFEDAP